MSKKMRDPSLSAGGVGGEKKGQTESVMLMSTCESAAPQPVDQQLCVGRVKRLSAEASSVLCLISFSRRTPSASSLSWWRGQTLITVQNEKGFVAPEHLESES